MSYLGPCLHCGHSEGDHDLGGPCHGSPDPIMAPCRCPGYESAAPPIHPGDCRMLIEQNILDLHQMVARIDSPDCEYDYPHRDTLTQHLITAMTYLRAAANTVA